MERSEAIATLAVALGGALGAAARWGVGTQVDFDPTSTAFPWHTFAVNVIGCLAIGLAAARLERGTIGWAFVVTGLLGGFTTMSAFAVELNDLADAGRTATVATYLGATLAVGVAATLVGERALRRSDA